MALIDCPECGTQVSSAAPSCPRCGVPIAAVAVERESSGGRAAYSDQEVAVLLSQKGKTSHLLHFFISLFTLGIWIPVWIFLSISNAIGNDWIDSKIAKGKKRSYPAAVEAGPAEGDEPKSTWRRIAAAVPPALAALVVGYLLIVLVGTMCSA